MVRRTHPTGLSRLKLVALHQVGSSSEYRYFEDEEAVLVLLDLFWLVILATFYFINKIIA